MKGASKCSISTHTWCHSAIKLIKHFPEEASPNHKGRQQAHGIFTSAAQASRKVQSKPFCLSLKHMDSSCTNVVICRIPAGGRFSISSPTAQTVLQIVLECQDAFWRGHQLDNCYVLYLEESVWAGSWHSKLQQLLSWQRGMASVQLRSMEALRSLIRWTSSR